MPIPAFFKSGNRYSSRLSAMVFADQILVIIDGNHPLYLREMIPAGQSWQQLFSAILAREKITKAEIYVVLGTGQYQQFSIESPQVPESEIPGALPWAIKDFTSEPVTELAIDYYDAFMNPSMQSRLQVICTPKKRIREWMDVLKSFGDLRSVTTDELGLVDLFGSQFRLDVLLYQLPDQDLLMLAVFEGRLCFSRVMRGFMPLVQQTPEQWPSSILDNLALELQRTFDYLSSQLKLPEVSMLHIAISTPDKGAVIRGLKQLFSFPIQLLTSPATIQGMDFLPLWGVLKGARADEDES